ncbi:MAG: carbohydrate kinase family protein [Planctomycetota bacterium]
MPPGDNAELVCIGHAAIDFGAHVGSFPLPDTKVLSREVSCQGGGPAATAACTAARLGIKASFIGTVGDDLQGQFIREEFQSDGVDISETIIRPNSSSPVSIILVQPVAATRTIIWNRGSAEKLSPDELNPETVRNAKCLLVDGHQMEASIRAAELARENGVPVVFDAGSMKPDTEELLKSVDHLITSLVFAEEFTGEDDPALALREIARQGFQSAAVTMGHKGAFVLSENGISHAPAFSVNVMDTTGAGDVFHGAYCFALIRGYRMADRIEIASAAAALKCTSLGARAGIPTMDGMKKFVKKHGSRPLIDRFLK